MDDSLVYNIEDPNIFYKEYDTSKNKSSPILNKYEKTQVIYERCNLILNGAKPYIKDPHKYNSVEEIVLEELRLNKIPFIIKRKIGWKYEYWKLQDLSIN